MRPARKPHDGTSVGEGDAGLLGSRQGDRWRTTRHAGYAISLRKRLLVEKPFGWLKRIGGLRKVKLRGLAKVDWLFVFGCAAYNLLRIPKLRSQCA